MGFSDNLPYEKVGKNEPVCIADEVPFDIPESWEWVRFSNIIELQSGQDMTPDKYNSTQLGIPYITGASNIANGNVVINRWTEYGKAFAHRGDLLLTCKGTVGSMAVLKEPQVHIARQLMAIRSLSDDIEISYIKIVLETLIPILKAAAKSMIPGIAREDVLHSLLPLPPTSEQKRICGKIKALLPHIEIYDIKEKTAAQLNSSFPDTLKKSVLQDAVQGKLVLQDSADEPASVLLEHIRAEKEQLIKAGKIKRDKHESVIFRRDNSYYEKVDGIERCIDDELPFEIPESWEWCRLGTILQKLTDGTHSTPKYTARGIPFISVKDISSGKISFERTKFISKTEHELLASRCDPHRDDILLTKVGTTGIPVLVDTDRPFSIFVSVAQLRFSTELLDKFFLIYLLKSPLVQTQCRENTKGVGNKNWVMRDIANTLICIPPLAEQKRIQASLANVLKSI